MRRLFAGLEDRAGNMPPLPGIYPDYPAPIIRNAGEAGSSSRRVGECRRRQYLAGKVDRVTNIRQTELVALAAPARARAPLSRALHPFAENETLADGSRPPVWFALDGSRPTPSPGCGRPGPARGR